MIALLCLFGVLIFLKCDGVYSGMGLAFAAAMIWIGRRYDRSQIILSRIAGKTVPNVPRT